MGSPGPDKRRKRRKPSAADIANFARQYARKASRGIDPNDRGFSHRIARQIKSMNPLELDRLLRDDENENAMPTDHD
jgi:hypothetical protein